MNVNLPRPYRMHTSAPDVMQQRVANRIASPSTGIPVAGRPDAIQMHNEIWANRLNGRTFGSRLSGLGWAPPAGVEPCYNTATGTITNSPTIDGASIDPRCHYGCYSNGVLCPDLSTMPDYFQRGYAIATANGYSAPNFNSDGTPVITAGSGATPLIGYVNPDGTWGITTSASFDNHQRPWFPGSNIMLGDPRFVKPPDSVIQQWFGAFDWSAFHQNYVNAVQQAQQQSAAAAAQSTGTGVPVSAYVPPVSTPPSSIPPGSTSTTGVTTVIPPVASTGSSGGPKLTFQNSRNSSTLYPGDSYTITITGAPPNQPVTANAILNGSSLPASQFGSTDANGTFQLQGSINDTSTGSWFETWFVGGQSVGSFSFMVGTGATTSQPTATTGSITPISTPLGISSPLPGTGTVTAGGSGSPMSEQLIAGVDNKTLLIGAGGLMLLLTMFGRR